MVTNNHILPRFFRGVREIPPFMARSAPLVRSTSHLAPIVHRIDTALFATHRIDTGTFCKSSQSIRALLATHRNRYTAFCSAFHRRSIDTQLFSTSCDTTKPTTCAPRILKRKKHPESAFSRKVGVLCQSSATSLFLLSGESLLVPFSIISSDCRCARFPLRRRGRRKRLAPLFRVAAVSH